VTGVEDKL
jgi:phospholipid-translocating ATPase